jgi:hypothetical protein
MIKTRTILGIAMMAVLALSLTSFTSKKSKKSMKPNQEIIDSICTEGHNLYIAELVNWISTDSVFAHYGKDDWEGNVIWQPTDSTWSAVFFDKGMKNCIFELSFNRSNVSISVSYDKRPITEIEKAQVEKKYTMLENAFSKYGDSIRNEPKCGELNIDFVRINDNLSRMYILQGTVHNNMIPFGNDYSVDFDNEANVLCFRRYHRSLLALKTVDDEGKPAESVMHSHLQDNPYITPTDICNFLLYRGSMRKTGVLSTAFEGLFYYDAENHTVEFEPLR